MRARRVSAGVREPGMRGGLRASSLWNSSRPVKALLAVMAARTGSGDHAAGEGVW